MDASCQTIYPTPHQLRRGTQNDFEMSSADTGI